MWFHVTWYAAWQRTLFVPRKEVQGREVGRDEAERQVTPCVRLLHLETAFDEEVAHMRAQFGIEKRREVA
ncbi:hypothetical protein GCM10008094_28120 [Aidingimonas halophila]|nr:hypothetical protein GCM10008094_28120 [Aidingimonas halophila]